MFVLVVILEREYVMHGSSFMEVDLPLSFDYRCSFLTFSEREHMAGKFCYGFKQLDVTSAMTKI